MGACLGRTFALRSGSWSNRTTPAPHAGDPGATPGGSTAERWSCGLAAKAALPTSGDDRWFESIQDYFGPDTPTGRAARLKPARLQVRVLLWALTNDRLGRQSADHPGLEPRMLWVRVPPEPLKNTHALVEQSGVLATLSRWRSRVQIPSRALAQHGTQTGKAAKLKPSRSFVGSTPTRATGKEQHASVGHWQASVAVTHSPPAVQVQLLPDALIDGIHGAVRCWFCSEAFNLAHAGSIPVRVTVWPGVMLVLQPGPQPGRRGFDSRPGH